MSSKICILIAGPTAVGKTALSIALAQHFQTAILSADSRQCYRELNIGVAKPSVEELQAVPHYFINTHAIQDDLNAADFEEYALRTAQQIFRQHDIMVMVGGTGLYIRAFCEGMDRVPPVDPALRASIRSSYAANGLDWLQTTLREKDPAYFSTAGVSGEATNAQRLMRALEVVEQTGHSITNYRRGQKAVRDFTILPVGLELPRAVLYNRINERVGQMMAAGLEAEARALWPHRHLNALQTVGYRELFGHFDGIHPLDRAVELIAQNTRHYAKRQMTWFRKDPSMIWLHPEQAFTAVVNSVAQKKAGQ